MRKIPNLYFNRQTMKLKSIILYGTLILLCGCSDKNGQVSRYSGFEQSVSVKSSSAEVPPVLLYPRSLFLSGNRLIVLNEKTDTLFQVFSVPELEYQGQFGIKGEGPADFQLPSIQPVGYTESGFILNDMDRLKYISWETSGPRVTSRSLPYDFRYFNGLVALKDSTYCCDAGFEDEHELRLLYPDGREEVFGTYPEEVAPRFKDVLARNQAYTHLQVAKPDGTRVAVFYQHLRRYRIYKADGGLDTDNVLDILPSQELPDMNDDERYIHPICLYATDRYIYSLNLDMTAAEIGNKERNPSIQLFDWEGRPVKQYQLDRFISSFTVDEPDGVVYGVFVDDENHIYKFKL